MLINIVNRYFISIYRTGLSIPTLVQKIYIFDKISQFDKNLFATISDSADSTNNSITDASRDYSTEYSRDASTDNSADCSTVETVQTDS